MNRQSTLLKCLYCGATSINYPMYEVLKATKPKHSPNRWKKIGYCCSKCDEKGMQNGYVCE